MEHSNMNWIWIGLTRMPQPLFCDPKMKKSTTKPGFLDVSRGVTVWYWILRDCVFPTERAGWTQGKRDLQCGFRAMMEVMALPREQGISPRGRPVMAPTAVSACCCIIEVIKHGAFLARDGFSLPEMPLQHFAPTDMQQHPYCTENTFQWIWRNNVDDWSTLSQLDPWDKELVPMSPVPWFRWSLLWLAQRQTNVVWITIDGWATICTETSAWYIQNSLH